MGLGICLRLIDDFLRTRDTSAHLNLIFTTRSARKSSDTLKALQEHLRRHHAVKQHGRVNFQAENVDLANLLSVRDLARKLLASDLEKLDIVICNAGIGGWKGMNWPHVFRDILLDIRNTLSWPDFKLGMCGSLTKIQLSTDGREPPLGEVFCANVFGHYLLVHWLMPLFRACSAASGGKIIWVSSIEPQDYHFDESDLQGLQTSSPYEHTKRLTDLLCLTSNQPETAKAVASFTSAASPLSHSNKARPDHGPPSMHDYHPGVLVTTVFPLPPIMHEGYMSAIYLARLLGGNWANINPYPAADAATWLTLASADEIRQAERDAHALADADASRSIAPAGKVKWGTSSSRLGTTSVRPTEVSGWGLNGTGQPYAQTWWGGLYGPDGKYGRGRKPDAVEATGQDVRDFVALGARVWAAMEALRQDWEGRIAASGM